jgi:CheY-like chemotaxis protein
MIVKTCLLVTDDPDDHQVIAEAISDISESTILLNILDSQKALLLMKEGEYRPDYLMLDISMHGIKINSILKFIRTESPEPRIPVIIYGPLEPFLQIEDHHNLIFFNKEYEYAELKDFLRKIFI